MGNCMIMNGNKPTYTLITTVTDTNTHSVSLKGYDALAFKIKYNYSTSSETAMYYFEAPTFAVEDALANTVDGLMFLTTMWSSNALRLHLKGSITSWYINTEKTNYGWKSIEIYGVKY